MNDPDEGWFDFTQQPKEQQLPFMTCNICQRAKEGVRLRISPRMRNITRATVACEQCFITDSHFTGETE